MMAPYCPLWQYGILPAVEQSLRSSCQEACEAGRCSTSGVGTLPLDDTGQVPLSVMERLPSMLAVGALYSPRFTKPVWFPLYKRCGALRSTNACVHLPQVARTTTLERNHTHTHTNRLLLAFFFLFLFRSMFGFCFCCFALCHVGSAVFQEAVCSACKDHGIEKRV